MIAPTHRYQQLCQRVNEIERQHGRATGTVQLLAVSKRHPAAAIAVLAQAGQRAFGENYLQEATGKIATLANLDLEWHFIGKIQSNKTRAIAESFAWVHSVDRLKIGERLNDQRPAELPPLNVCVEVNVSSESSKGGVAASDVNQLVSELDQLPRLRVRGLMTLPAPTDDETQQRAAFRAVAELLADLRRPKLDTLSMGTSADYPSAIAEGATMIRIGTQLFGPRPA